MRQLENQEIKTVSGGLYVDIIVPAPIYYPTVVEIVYPVTYIDDYYYEEVYYYDPYGYEIYEYYDVYHY